MRRNDGKRFLRAVRTVGACLNETKCENNYIAFGFRRHVPYSQLFFACERPLSRQSSPDLARHGMTSKEQWKVGNLIVCMFIVAIVVNSHRMGRSSQPHIAPATQTDIRPSVSEAAPSASPESRNSANDAELWPDDVAPTRTVSIPPFNFNISNGMLSDTIYPGEDVMYILDAAWAARPFTDNSSDQIQIGRDPMGVRIRPRNPNGSIMVRFQMIKIRDVGGNAIMTFVNQTGVYQLDPNWSRPPETPYHANQADMNPPPGLRRKVMQIPAVWGSSGDDVTRQDHIRSDEVNGVVYLVRKPPNISYEVGGSCTSGVYPVSVGQPRDLGNGLWEYRVWIKPVCTGGMLVKFFFHRK
jgi:hypothetical protein